MPDTTEPAERIQIAPQHRELLDQVLDKWSLQVLEELCEQPLRFNELRRAIPVVTQKSLTATLRRLERNGMVDRVITSSRPIAVEYRISQVGRTIQDLIDALFDWSAENMPDVERARARFDDEG
ncbi:winged helix-turn-helix transcriptional regulator [Promicromonospora soli]|uniref:HxlR family transcriptional regulator n=1 Tax=Promicromonospora soli TaxID=2035533 RepID=A0A919G104_9MICO|nr:helix-turn-helix domain-containing protein [Promicromonospora soli]GHH76187.1 HxlR family transcriptional regulator [Promicromonospora soli]